MSELRNQPLQEKMGGHVTSELNALENKVVQVDEKVNKLEALLQPILRSGGPEGSEDQKHPQPTLCELADHMRNITKNLQATEDTLTGILTRLEL